MAIVMNTRPAAYCLIQEKDKILLSYYESRDSSGRTFRGWTLPGGGIEVDEQPEQTAIREVYEETGFEIEIEKLLGVHTAYYRQKNQPVFCAHRTIYSAQILTGQLKVEEEGTTKDVRWVALDELEGYLPGIDRTQSIFEALARMLGYRGLSDWVDSVSVQAKSVQAKEG